MAYSSKLLSRKDQELLQSQWEYGSSFNQKAVVKLFHPLSLFTFYLVNQDPKDPDYCWAVVKGFDIEMGSVSLSELETISILGIGIEKDKKFKPIPVEDLWKRLQNGEHI